MIRNARGGSTTTQAANGSSLGSIPCLPLHLLTASDPNRSAALDNARLIMRNNNLISRAEFEYRPAEQLVAMGKTDTRSQPIAPRDLLRTVHTYGPL